MFSIYIVQHFCFLVFVRQFYIHICYFYLMPFYNSFLVRLFISVAFVSISLSLFPLAFIPFCNRRSTNFEHFNNVAQSIVNIRDVFDPYVCFLHHHHLIIKEKFSLKITHLFILFALLLPFSPSFIILFYPSFSNSPHKGSSIAFNSL